MFALRYQLSALVAVVSVYRPHRRLPVNRHHDSYPGLWVDNTLFIPPSRFVCHLEAFNSAFPI